MTNMCKCRSTVHSAQVYKHWTSLNIIEPCAFESTSFQPQLEHRHRVHRVHRPRMASPPNKNRCSLGGRCISPWLQLRTWWPSRYLHPPGWYLARCTKHHQTMERGKQIPLSLGYLCKISPIFPHMSWDETIKTSQNHGTLGRNGITPLKPRLDELWRPPQVDFDPSVPESSKRFHLPAIPLSAH